MAWSKNSPAQATKRKSPAAPAKPFRTCDILAEEYSADVIRIIGKREVHALVLFHKLRDVRPEFPDCIFKFYDMMGAIRAGGKVKARAEKSDRDGITTMRIFYRLTE
jgi:hypothetical protein